MAEKKINGRTFKTEPMLATQALVLQARLFKALGPAVARIGDVMAGYGTDKTDEQKAKSNMAAVGALTEIFTQSNPEDMANLVKDVVEVAQIKRDSGVYENCDLDGDFTGKQKDLIPVVAFVLREQFGDFFGGLPGLGNPGK